MSEEKEELTDKDLDEIIDELEQEVEEEETYMVINTPIAKKWKWKSKSYWRNLKYLWYYPYRKTPMQKHFQRLAGITPECVARLTLPDKTVVEFKELPKWYDVLRYQISGFKFEVFHLDDIC